jgi:hypothetical protein
MSLQNVVASSVQLVLWLFAYVTSCLHVSQFLCSLVFKEHNGQISQDSLVSDRATGWMFHGMVPGRSKRFIYALSKTAWLWGLSGYQKFFFPGVKWLEHAADHFPQSSADFMNGGAILLSTLSAFLV